jgi:hypothetical protein
VIVGMMTVGVMRMKTISGGVIGDCELMMTVIVNDGYE